MMVAPFFHAIFIFWTQTQTASLTVVDGDLELLWYTEANYMCD